MLTWVNSHGIEAIVGYMAFAAIVGSMPPLPENSSYWAHWAYGALHALSMNLRAAAQLFKLNIPETEKDK